jgi:c-di-GMP-binding flagellar brake protein YcgR
MEIPNRIFERRRAVRVEDQLAFSIGHAGYDISATTLNISTSGAMCLVDRDVPVMTQLDIVLSLPFPPSSKGKKIRVRGVVVRKERDAATGKFFLAIYFSELKGQAFQALMDYIKSRLQAGNGR